MTRRWFSLLLVLFTYFSSATPAISAPHSPTATAVFAGGCFWCMEKPFDEVPGVLDTTSGYTGGTVENPNYYQVSAGGTGHVESVQVTYDPTQVSYETLLDVFWHNVDPVDNKGQFCDKGSQYRSAIFYGNDQERETAIASKSSLEKSQKIEQSIATDILPTSTFYPAEDYHQNYYQTHPVRYRVYRFGCGRDQRLAEVWGDEAGH
ncbi:peptide-methionine (S)-S-oxide reductase MsrA [Oscillatoria sp. CS-180]|uniref:peptide-methionine (S)-S-oxide reductase MsrA n=1 Tax=Oscillatoria sp. CS-180 TaxID=3021720 RepID=UPI00232C3B73|nr:peptide-methionine (S)-S-oxide reductase MsrA [Oscillatoria sp. CS-180]MDB9528405.1 peptide-methionine (S)-S-oxide reductase MsrA [Oscillatoria sp. CS-180]